MGHLGSFLEGGGGEMRFGLFVFVCGFEIGGFWEGGGGKKGVGAGWRFGGGGGKGIFFYWMGGLC